MLNMSIDQDEFAKWKKMAQTKRKSNKNNGSLIEFASQYGANNEHK